jgi:SPW repeat
MKTVRWQDLSETLIGLWLLSAPLVFGFFQAPDTTAMWNAFFVGTAVTLLAAEAVRAPAAWEELINIALGLWLVVSPWVLHYTDLKRATLNAVIVGSAIVMLALWAMLTDKGYQHWYQKTMHSPR